MSKGKVFISTSSFAEFSSKPLDLLNNAGYQGVLNPHGRKLKAEEIISLFQNCVGVIAGTEHLPREIINKLPELKVISRCGAGMDNVDLNAAEELGLIVKNTPDAPTLAVAELTIGLMMNMLRNISQMDRAMRIGKWHKPMGTLLTGKKVGIIGFGRIGKKVAESLKHFNVEIAYYDSFKATQFLDIPKMSMEELLIWSDIVSIHISTGERLIGKKELDLLGPKGWIINTSRGGVVDELALYEALKTENLQGAAIDVFEQEPYLGPLKELNNVILTPHIGSYARESRIEMEVESVRNLLTALEGKS